VGTLPQELSSLQLTGEPVMVQSKKKPSGAQRKCLRKQKEAPYNSLRPLEVFNIRFHSTLVRNTRSFTGLWAHLWPGSMKDNFASTETELNYDRDGVGKVPVDRQSLQNLCLILSCQTWNTAVYVKTVCIMFKDVK